MVRPKDGNRVRGSSGPLPPGVERRRRLREERRRERLIQSWRILLYGGVSTGLIWVLLSTGWSLRSQQQLTVRGSDRLGTDAVVKAAGLRFPRPLITLEPGRLERRLLAELPVESVSVQRRLVPPGLEVKLKDRQPIAAASRMGARGLEQGMVDRQGHWMPLTVARQGEAPSSAVRVEGWIPSRRRMIATVLEQRDQLGSPLQVIKIAPDGDLSLRTQTLGLVRLGSNERLLDQQLLTIVLLSSSLPETLRGKASSGIDLSDPSKPELQLQPKQPQAAKQQTSKP